LNLKKAEKHRRKRHEKGGAKGGRKRGAKGAHLLLLLAGLLGGSARPLLLPLRLGLAGLCLMVALPYSVLYLETALGRAGGNRQRSPVTAGSRELAAFVRGHEPHGSIVVYSPWMEDSFPWVLETGTEWGSRYPFMWFVPALYRKALKSGEPLRYRSEQEMGPVARRLIHSVADDLQRFRPAYVFVRRPVGPGFLRLDILAAFQEGPEFRRAFAPYRPVMELEHFRVFQRLPLALARSEPGEVEAEHLKAALSQLLRNAGSGKNVFRAGEAMREYRCRFGHARGTVKARRKCVPLRAGESNLFG
jgi:hypothetical protein